MGFEGKAVLITGASSGIGRASAAEFARRGARVILVSREEGRLGRARAELEELGAGVTAYRCDVSDRRAVEEMSGRVLEEFGSVDVLVNNAGFVVYGPVLDIATDEIEAQMNTNYFGMVYCIKGFLPSMLEKKSGHIVNVASVAASVGLPKMASYCASKFAMLGFSEALKHELQGSGVGVTVVSPIMVRTDFFRHPSFGDMPNFSASLSPATVARAVVRAARSPRLEIIVPSAVRGAVWAKQTFPYLVNPALSRAFRGGRPGSGGYSESSSAPPDPSDPTSSSSSDFSSN